MSIALFLFVENFFLGGGQQYLGKGKSLSGEGNPFPLAESQYSSHVDKQVTNCPWEPYFESEIRLMPCIQRIQVC